MIGSPMPAGHKLDLMKVRTPRPINVDGSKGDKCSYCAGWGFTIFITDGQAHYCTTCGYSGVEPKGAV